MWYSKKLLPVTGAVATIALGFVFLAAGLLKGADPQLFVDQINSYKILPEAFGQPMAYILIVVEVVLGIAAILLLVPRLTTTTIMGVLMVFIAATGWAWAHGNAESCGCFSRAASRGPLGVILEDIGFLGLGVLSLLFVKWSPPARTRWIAFGVVLPALISLPFWMPKMPVDPWVTPIRTGADLSHIAIDGVMTPVSDGTVLLAMVGSDCEPCDLSVSVLDQIAQNKDGPVVVGVFAGTNRERRAFVLEHVPAFAIGHSSENALRQYYRRLPVFVLLEDGKVERAWWGEAPDKEEVLSAMRSRVRSAAQRVRSALPRHNTTSTVLST